MKMKISDAIKLIESKTGKKVIFENDFNYGKNPEGSLIKLSGEGIWFNIKSKGEDTVGILIAYDRNNKVGVFDLSPSEKEILVTIQYKNIGDIADI